jgi:DNA polymerase-1
MQAQAVADRFGISVTEAEHQRAAFLNCYPAVRAAMSEAAADGRVRGHANIVGGLRRHIAGGTKAANQLINTPVQGSAGVVFREAIVRLFQHFRGTATKLILPVHDAVVIECDAPVIETVTQQAQLIMVSAVWKYYPAINPRVEANFSNPNCWNKDGHADSFGKFLEEPLYKLI